MVNSSASGSIFSSLWTTSSSQVTTEGLPNKTRADVASYILADLHDAEHCDVDQLLAVFLEGCRATDPPTNPSTPRIPQTGVQSAGSSKTASPSSTTTERPSENSSEATTDPTSSAPDPQGTANPPVSRELFDSCLQKVLTICKDPEIEEFIKNYQQGFKEKPRYRPFVRLCNRGLELLKPLGLPGLRTASTSEILFQVNDGKAIKIRGDAVRVPDIVVVPLASAKRARREKNGSWEECANEDCPQKSRNQFDCSDLLISGEMKWHRPTLDLQVPETYDTALKQYIKQVPIHKGDTDLSAILSGNSASNSNTTSNASFSNSSSRADSTDDSAPPLTGVVKSGAGIGRDLKRRADHPDQGSPKKMALAKNRVSDSNHKTKENMLDAVVQSGINGAEMLGCSLGRRHTFGMVILDAMIWIWWYDRQGAIQSTGINFIQDLPRFLVFLFAIQRFSIADWGFDEKLDPSIPLRHFSDNHQSPTLQPVEYEVDGEVGKFKIGFNLSTTGPMHGRFSLRGKATSVLGVTTNLDLDKKIEFVAKFSWPNQDRPHEAEVIKHARQVTGQHNHLPDVFGWLDIDPIGTRLIRELLGISESPRPPRLFRILVSEKLFPITQRRGDGFVFAWLQCVRCHYLLWERQTRHLDLSLANLMVRIRIHEGMQEYFGVLNDWDLGDMQESRPESRKDLTKTILFTALDLLNPVSPEKQVVQRYAHDLESFFWILIWVFLVVQEEKVEPTEKVARWLTGDPVASSERRSLFLAATQTYPPHEEWRPYWIMARKITKWSRLHLGSENEAFDENEPSNQDETPERRKELLRGLLEIVKEHYGVKMPSSPEVEGL